MLAVLFLVCVFFYFCFKEGENSAHAIKNRNKSAENNRPVYHDDYGHMYLTENGHEAVSGFSKNGDWVIRDVKTGKEYGRNSKIEEAKRESELCRKNRELGIDATLVKEGGNPAKFHFGFPEPGSTHKKVYAVSSNGWLAFEQFLTFSSGVTPYDSRREVHAITIHFWQRLYNGDVIPRNPRWYEDNYLAEHPDDLDREYYIKRKHNEEKEIGEKLIPIINNYFSSHLEDSERYKTKSSYKMDVINGSFEWLVHLNRQWDNLIKWLKETGINDAVKNYLYAINSLEQWDDTCFCIDLCKKTNNKKHIKGREKWYKIENLYETKKEIQEYRRETKKELESNIYKAKKELDNKLEEINYQLTNK